MWSDPIYDQINYVKMRNGIWRFRLQVVSIDQVRSALIHPLKATGRFTGMTFKMTTSRALLQSFASHGDHILDGWTTVLGISRWSHPTIAKVSYGFRRLIDVEQRVCCLVQERSWIYPIRQTTFVGSYSVSVVGFGSNVLRSSVISKKENRNTKKSTQKHPVYMYICIYIVIMSYIYRYLHGEIQIHDISWEPFCLRPSIYCHRRHRTVSVAPPEASGSSPRVWNVVGWCHKFHILSVYLLSRMTIYSCTCIYIYLFISMMAIMMLEHESIVIWWLFYEYE